MIKIRIKVTFGGAGSTWEKILWYTYCSMFDLGSSVVGEYVCKILSLFCICVIPQKKFKSHKNIITTKKGIR